MIIKKLCLGAALLMASSLSAQIEVEVKKDAKKIDVDKARGNTPDIKRNSVISAGQDSVNFLAGDSFVGELVSIVDGKMTWRHSESETPLVFRTDNFSSLEFTGAKDEIPVENIIELSNGDVLPCNIVSLNAEEAVVKTWFSGEVRILRAMIKSIRFSEKNDKLLLATMPKNERQMKKDWKVSGGWSFKDDAFVTSKSGYVGRELAKADKISVQFKLTRTHNANTEVYLFADPSKGTSSSGYVFRFYQNYVNCYVKEKGGRSRYFGNIYYNNNGGNMNNLNIRIFADRVNNQFHIIVNGKPLQVAKPTRVTNTPALNGIMFSCSSSGLEMKVSELLVKKWDGQIELGSSSSKKKDEEELSKIDKVTFTNSDAVSGKLIAIKDGQATFKTDFATMEIPVARMALMEFSGEELERARRNKRDVQGVLADGRGMITFQLVEYKDGRLKAMSENFGEISISRFLFSDVQFNIYKKAKKKTKK